MLYPKIRFHKDKMKGGFVWKRLGQRGIMFGTHPLSLTSFWRFCKYFVGYHRRYTLKLK